jgi:hypothetical protein
MEREIKTVVGGDDLTVGVDAKGTVVDMVEVCF